MELQYKECLVRDPSKSSHQRKLAYIEWGSPDAYPVICVHGLTRNAHDFDYIAAELAKNFRVICIDVIGRGRSEYATNLSYYSYKQYVTDLHNFLTALNINEAYYIGTSMGGIIGMIYASTFRGTIKKMVLNDIGAYIPAKALAKIAEYVSKYQVFASFAEAELYLKEIFKNFGINSEDKWQHFTEHSIIQNDDGRYRLNYDSQISTIFKSPATYATDANLWGFWNTLKKTLPILVLRGEFSNILSMITVAQMKITHPNCTEIVIKNVGHAPSLMDEEQISLVKSWLLN
ncbi:MAG: alpha/beta hydrolase [Alphaproteobacteria bacterium]|jgi:pimeloyl-ACP methyl ester carboxylesterase